MLRIQELAEMGFVGGWGLIEKPLEASVAGFLVLVGIRGCTLNPKS